MGKRKIANTVFLQHSFGINSFFLKMYMWCCDMFFWRKVSMVLKCCDDSFPSVNEILWILKSFVAENQGLATWVSEKLQIQFFFSILLA